MATPRPCPRCRDSERRGQILCKKCGGTGYGRLAASWPVATAMERGTINARGAKALAKCTTIEIEHGLHDNSVALSREDTMADTCHISGFANVAYDNLRQQYALYYHAQVRPQTGVL